MKVSNVLKIVLLLFGKESLAYYAPMVETPLGHVQGFTMLSRSGRNFSAFQGVPYAKPPVGHLRFKPPQEPEPWTGILIADGTNMPKCLQRDNTNQTARIPVGKEDCLYLTIYTHNFNISKPVLFYIHGGAFLNGDALNPGPQFLMDEDIVIVGVQYRLNIFGFLSFEDSELPGNQGMKDQVMALQWVQKNIHLFGGDPNDVTIIGGSAGGASVYHHLISPMSKGLYHKAISESGTSYSVWTLPPPGLAKSLAEKVAAALDCPKISKDAVPCLIQKDAGDFIKRAMNVTTELGFSPVFESGKDAFLIGPISKWKHNSVPLIIGMTSAEGFVATLKYLQSDAAFKNFTQDFSTSTAKFLLYDRSASNPDEVTKSVHRYYGFDKSLTLNNWKNITDAFTDSWFSIGFLEGLFKHTGPAYSYYFDYVASAYIPKWLKNESLYFGAEHVAEVKFIWNLTSEWNTNKSFNNAEINLSKKLVKMVTDFMKYGNPTPDKNNFVWKMWTAKTPNFLYIDKKAELSLVTSLLPEKYTFWKSIKYRDLYDLMESRAENLSFTLRLLLLSFLVFSLRYYSF